jgi:hypothetical protein
MSATEYQDSQTRRGIFLRLRRVHFFLSFAKYEKDLRAPQAREVMPRSSSTDNAGNHDDLFCCGIESIDALCGLAGSNAKCCCTSGTLLCKNAFGFAHSSNGFWVSCL